MASRYRAGDRGVWCSLDVPAAEQPDEQLSELLSARRVRFDSPAIRCRRLQLDRCRGRRAVAGNVLTVDGHEHAAYDLTGPAPLTVDDVATALTEASGRAIRYVDVPEAAARKAMLDMGMPAWLADALMELHAVDKQGGKAFVPPTRP